MLTFLASGLWHGSSWNFVVWGGINGIYNVVSDITAGFRDKAAGMTHFDGKRMSGRLFKGIVTFILADYAWMYFRAGSLSEAFDMTLRILTDFRLYTVCGDWIYDLGLSEMQVRSLIPAIFVLFVVDMVHEKNISIIDWLKKQGVVFRFSCYIFSILLIMLTAVQNLGRSPASRSDMRAFWVKLFTVAAVILLITGIIEVLSYDDDYSMPIAKLTESDTYLTHMDGPDWIVPLIEKVSAEDESHVLLVGDSVCRQMFIDIMDINKETCVAPAISPFVS